MQSVSREEARVCASVVRDIARDRGVANDPAAVGKLTVEIARLFNNGARSREELLAAAAVEPPIPPRSPAP